ncbi:MAG: UvrB/UvrC motif-containing protein, partial [Clostridia bacterium]|nr:UvrB/UvrC motif-containing protein [Clostridia bacterium]
KKQSDYNAEHGIVPKTIIKDVREIIEISTGADDDGAYVRMSRADRDKLVAKLTAEMKEAAKILEFEHAAYLRDKIEKIKNAKPGKTKR